MHRVRRASLQLLIIALLLATALAPMTGGQVPSQSYCPAGDQGDQSPNGITPTRSHVDLTLGAVRLDIAGEQGIKRGNHLVTRSSGDASIGVEVKNIGAANPGGASTLRLVLEPAGSTTSITRTPSFNIPGPGQTTTVTTTFSFDPGRYTLSMEVNPDDSPAETCTDTAANPNCGSATSPCTTTYRDNNKGVIGLITGGLPALSIHSISTTSPVRATLDAHADSTARIDVTVRNSGNTPAFDLNELKPSDGPLQVRIEAVGCSCEPVTATTQSIGPGATRTASATMPLHGLKGEYEIKVTIDPDAKTADLDRVHVTGGDTFRIPTPDLAVEVVSTLENDAGRLLVPEGDDLAFDAVITNHGDAPARATNGTGFLVTVHRDNLQTLVHSERLTLSAGASATVQIVDNATNLSGAHIYRIRADAQNEVLETTKANNTRDIRVAIAVYDALLEVDAAESQKTVPPGIGAKVAFTLENTGTVTDTYALSSPSADRDVQHYEDASGERITEARIAAGEEFKGHLVRMIPRDAAEGDTHKTTLQARSTTTNALLTEDITLLVGPDDVPPTIELQRPATGYMNDDRIVLRVTDNVALKSVQTDITGSYRTLQPDDDGDDTYTIDATGTPAKFTLNVRAEDSAGNRADQAFEIVRDSTPPRIVKAVFSPARGIVPGQAISLQVEARDSNLDRVEIQITQPRPGGMYSENRTLRGEGPNLYLRDWVVPERPGHYIFNLTAYDKAGNSAKRGELLFVPGLNIRMVGSQPTVRPPAPSEGERVTLSYILENTSPRFETGPFFVSLVIDFERQIGLQRINLAAGERQLVTFTWAATSGAHAFTLVIDQAEEVAEDNEEDNLHFTTTDILFPDQPLFAHEMVRVSGFETFGERLKRYWFLPVIFIATLALFGLAVVLARRQPELA